MCSATHEPERRQRARPAVRRWTVAARQGVRHLRADGALHPDARGGRRSARAADPPAASTGRPCRTRITDQLVFGVDALVSFLSCRQSRWSPATSIATGTPPGVGFAPQAADLPQARRRRRNRGRRVGAFEYSGRGQSVGPWVHRSVGAAGQTRVRMNPWTSWTYGPMNLWTFVQRRPQAVRADGRARWCWRFRSNAGRSPRAHRREQRRQEHAA